MKGFRKKRAVFSDETYELWGKRQKERKDFSDKHSHITERVVRVSDFFIVCIQRKYDPCMKRANQYGIQVWNTVDRTDPDHCLANEWFTNADEANERFLFLKANCED